MNKVLFMLQAALVALVCLLATSVPYSTQQPEELVEDGGHSTVYNGGPTVSIPNGSAPLNVCEYNTPVVELPFSTNVSFPNKATAPLVYMEPEVESSLSSALEGSQLLHQKIVHGSGKMFMNIIVKTTPLPWRESGVHRSTGTGTGGDNHGYSRNPRVQNPVCFGVDLLILAVRAYIVISSKKERRRQRLERRLRSRRNAMFVVLERPGRDLFRQNAAAHRRAVAAADAATAAAAFDQQQAMAFMAILEALVADTAGCDKKHAQQEQLIEQATPVSASSEIDTDHSWSTSAVNTVIIALAETVFAPRQPSNTNNAELPPSAAVESNPTAAIAAQEMVTGVMSEALVSVATSVIAAASALAKTVATHYVGEALNKAVLTMAAKAADQSAAPSAAGENLLTDDMTESSDGVSTPASGSRDGYEQRANSVTAGDEIPLLSSAPTVSPPSTVATAATACVGPSTTTDAPSADLDNNHASPALGADTKQPEGCAAVKPPDRAQRNKGERKLRKRRVNLKKQAKKDLQSQHKPFENNKRSAAGQASAPRETPALDDASAQQQQQQQQPDNKAATAWSDDVMTNGTKLQKKAKQKQGIPAGKAKGSANTGKSNTKTGNTSTSPAHGENTMAGQSSVVVKTSPTAAAAKKAKSEREAATAAAAAAASSAKAAKEAASVAANIKAENEAAAIRVKMEEEAAVAAQAKIWEAIVQEQRRIKLAADAEAAATAAEAAVAAKQEKTEREAAAAAAAAVARRTDAQTRAAIAAAAAASSGEETSWEEIVAEQRRIESESRVGGAKACTASSEHQRRVEHEVEVLKKAADAAACSRGILNRRNHCFLLAALQFIRGLPLCHKKLLSFSKSTDRTPPEGMELTWAVSRALLALQATDEGAAAFDPSELIDVFFSMFKGTIFVDGKQEDMSLALGQILDKIDSETRDPTTGSSLVDSARAQVCETVFCKNCKDTVTQTNACWVFQLTVMASTVQGNTTAKGKKGQKGKKPERVWGIPALIRHTLETRTQESQCEMCKAKKRSFSQALTHVPAEFILNFPRFEQTAGRPLGDWGRCDDQLTVTEALDKSALFGGSNTGTAKVVALGSHYGPSANSGHWTAAHRVRGENENPNAPRKWVRFDDGRVSHETLRNKDSLVSDEWRRNATVVAYATVPGRNTNKINKNKNVTRSKKR